MHGPIEFDGANIEDFVILRSDGHPTYHLSVVSDDVEMEITHVVRGDDHISNTPKQILLYRALGAPVPQFAHVPLILGPDKKRLSKRHGATSVMEYARQGFLPEAMVNFLALLGWSPGAAIASCSRRDELVDGVRARRASAAATRCSIRRSSTGSTSSTSCAWRPTSWRGAFEAVVRGGGVCGATTYLDERHAWFFAVLELLKPRVKRLGEFVAQGRFFFIDEIEYDPQAVDQASARDGASIWWRSTPRARSCRRSSRHRLKRRFARVADARGVKAASLIHACRVAVTGKAVSPGLFEVLALLGRRRVHERLRRGRGCASQRVPPEPAPSVLPRQPR